MKGPKKAKNDRKGAYNGKNEEKGAYKVQKEGNKLSKKFFSENIKKVLRAYESLNPAVVFGSQGWLFYTGLTLLLFIPRKNFTMR